MNLDLDEIIKALAHPVRRDILNWLKNPKAEFPEQLHNHEYGICAGQIDQRCGLSQSTVSAHLATLQRAGLISSQKAGQWHFSDVTRTSSRRSSTPSVKSSDP